MRDRVLAGDWGQTVIETLHFYISRLAEKLTLCPENPLIRMAQGGSSSPIGR
jgi:hypothetical protein